MDQYKENLLKNAKFQVKKAGGKVIVRGFFNERKVSFYGNNGQNCVVWYPRERRVKDLDIQDLKEAIKEFSGFEPFQMPD